MDEAIDGAAVIQNLKYTVCAAADGIHATITFVVGAVTYVYKGTITLIEEVFGLVESLFTVVKVAFDELFEWLGELFNWAKIRRTHQAVKYADTGGRVAVPPGGADRLQTTVDGGLRITPPADRAGVRRP